MIYIIIGIVFLIVTLFVNINKSLPRKEKKQVPPSHYTGKMLIDLERCYLLSSGKPVEPFTPDINHPYVSALDPEMYEQDTQKNTYQTIIVFEEDGKKFYSYPINKGKTTVEYYMITKKQTTIYYDYKNPGNYFFDLSFLTE
jgi:hypothetical protein